jgi:hypothetical protein
MATLHAVSTLHGSWIQVLVPVSRLLLNRGQFVSGHFVEIFQDKVHAPLGLELVAVTMQKVPIKKVEGQAFSPVRSFGL